MPRFVVMSDSGLQAFVSTRRGPADGVGAPEATRLGSSPGAGSLRARRGLLYTAFVGLLAGCAGGKPSHAPVSAPSQPDQAAAPRAPAPTVSPGPDEAAPAARPAPARVPQPVPRVEIAPAAPGAPPAPPSGAAEAHARVSLLLPEHLADRAGWAQDIQTAFAALNIPPTVENLCGVLAVAEQESNLRADPPVAGLARIAWGEIERRRKRAGIPELVLDAALALPSPNGKTYRRRLQTVKTERELSEIFEDFIGMVPLARTFLAESNPVRTGGPMQVSVAFAEAHVAAQPYPYHPSGSIRHEVFTRRGGMYFGIAHLLGYRAPYADLIYRFADFNAGQYASRNAAFQNAVARVTGMRLVLDGDLLRHDGDEILARTSRTELAARTLARRLGLDDAAIRRDLALEKTERLEQTRLYRRVFELADRQAGKPLPRAMLPFIALHSPKITHQLTTRWFARRVDGRYRSCLAQAAMRGERVPLRR